MSRKSTKLKESSSDWLNSGNAVITTFEWKRCDFRVSAFCQIVQKQYLSEVEKWIIINLTACCLGNIPAKKLSKSLDVHGRYSKSKQCRFLGHSVMLNPTDADGHRDAEVENITHYKRQRISFDVSWKEKIINDEVKTWCGQRGQTFAPVTPPGELDETCVTITIIIIIYFAQKWLTISIYTPWQTPTCSDWARLTRLHGSTYLLPPTDKNWKQNKPSKSYKQSKNMLKQKRKLRILVRSTLRREHRN